MSEGVVVNLRDFPRGQPLPPDVVRICRPSRWGNPYRIGEHGQSRETVIGWYRRDLAAILLRQPDYLEPLRGKRLACWCPPLPCHGDVILAALRGQP